MSAVRKPLAFLPLLVAALLPACAGAPEKPQVSCPQPRATVQAPPEDLQRQNPFATGNYDRDHARHIFETNDGAGCIACHGKKGDGRGVLAPRLAVAPRDFTCGATMAAIPDSQLFWVIRNGSPGTPMLGHEELSDTETWQVVRYLREFAR